MKKIFLLLLLLAAENAVAASYLQCRLTAVRRDFQPRYAYVKDVSIAEDTTTIVSVYSGDAGGAPTFSLLLTNTNQQLSIKPDEQSPQYAQSPIEGGYKFEDFLLTGAVTCSPSVAPYLFHLPTGEMELATSLTSYNVLYTPDRNGFRTLNSCFTGDYTAAQENVVRALNRDAHPNLATARADSHYVGFRFMVNATPATATPEELRVVLNYRTCKKESEATCPDGCTSCLEYSDVLQSTLIIPSCH